MLTKLDSVEAFVDYLIEHNTTTDQFIDLMFTTGNYFRDESDFDYETFCKLRETVCTNLSVKRNEIIYLLPKVKEDFWALMREKTRIYYDYYIIPQLRFPKGIDATIKHKVLYRVAETYSAHWSLEHPGKIAYTPNQEYLLQDRQVVIKLGRFLNKIASDLLTPDQIRDIATMSNIDFNCELRWATTEEDIVWVYENGPESCMGKPASAFESSVHPVAAYDSPDIAIAYVYNTKKDEVISRACCNVNDKQFNRIFGERSTIAPFLYQQGYTENIDALVGCRIKKIADDNDEYIGPYIDADTDYQICRLTNDLDHFIIGDDQPNAGDVVGKCWNSVESSGYISTDNEPGVECESCGVNCPDEDLFYCEECGDRICDGCVGSTDDDAILCSHCLDAHTYEVVDRDGDPLRLWRLPPGAVDVDGDLYVDEEAANDNGWYRCRMCNEWHDEDHLNENDVCADCAETEEEAA